MTGRRLKADNMKNTVKILLCLITAALLLSSCTRAADTAQISMYDLKNAMVQSTEFGDMTYVSSSDSDAEKSFGYLSDMDYSKIDSFFMYYASDGAKSADEIAVISVRDGKDTGEALNSLKDHLEYRKSLYRNYGADQLPKLNRAVTVSKGNCVALIICDDISAVREAFENYLKQH